MNYTANYHLPQWVKSDRIMMDDFNQMCMDIEAGLSKTAQAAEELGQTGDVRDKLLARRLIRLAYNQYLTAQAITPFPKQPGVFYQKAVRDLPSYGGEDWDGACFLGTGTGNFTIENFFQQCGKIISNLVTDKKNPANNKPLEMEICAPVTTAVTKFNLYGNVSENVPNTYAPFQVTLKNLNTGETEQSFKLNLQSEHVSVILVNNPQPATLYFLSGCRYLLRIEPIGDPVFSSTLAVGHGTGMQMRSSGGSNKRLNISYTMREQESYSIGLLILKCRAGGVTGQLTITWDGKTMEPVCVRQCQNDQGLDLREMIYIRREPIPAATTFSMCFECGANGSIWFQDWGAILL